MAASGSEMDCGTSAERSAWLREVGRWSSARARDIASKGLPMAAAARRGDVYLLPADVTNAPFRRPFDLEGRTLVFERQGTDAFAMRNVDLDWETSQGSRVTLSNNAESRAAISLDFDFPFYGRSVRTIHVTGYNALFLDVPQASQLYQYGDADLAAERQALIAPLLTTRLSRLAPVPEVYVRKDSDRVVVTWNSVDRYRVQATLHQSGEIRFSYQRVTGMAAASVIVTSGSEPWRERRTVVAGRTDAANDLRTTVAPGVAGMLDITNVSIERVNDMDLYQVRIQTTAPVAASALADGEILQFNVNMGSQSIRFQVHADGRQRYLLPIWGWNWGSPAAHVAGSEIVLAFMREHVAELPTLPVSVWSYRNGTPADSTETFSTPMQAGAKPARTDFSATSERLFDGEPVIEAFTAPVLSVFRVWEQLKQSDPSLNDDLIDGVAIYQNFYTDIVTYAGAYSTGGNAGVSGLAQGDEGGMFQSREPALMHMNTIGYGHNRTSRGASRVVLHEIGHRWLLFTSLLENGTRSRILNPVSAHPAQYVDTRAAFKVYTDTDTSVMGGGHFTDHNDGSFSSSSYGPYGYSWLDLYLMGLAGASEVPPMFYIRDANPELGQEYYAPVNQTYSGTRRDFTIDQVIGGTGPRQPAYPRTQKNFRVVFVLLTNPDREPTEEEIAAVDEYRHLLETDFGTATNHRGTVTTTLTPPAPGPRRRAVPK